MSGNCKRVTDGEVREFRVGNLGGVVVDGGIRAELRRGFKMPLNNSDLIIY